MFNKAAITGVDENGNKVGVGERIFRGALALPIAKPVKGVKMATKYGDDVLAAGKKKFDDFAQRSKKVACNCPGGSGKLKSIGNGKWKSSAGLIYGQGSKHGNRVKHVLAHARPDPTKPKHSVFVGGRKKVLGLVDEAWSMRSKVKPVIQKNGNAVYNVPMGKQVGTQGEKTVRIVVRQGTSEVITAFPVP
ncbi:hypothetical protein SAMN04488112_1252 [Melghirimyces thermohalophilus]|uniref:Bacterial EndoU nuclease domain-containing protein n=1 Tax=Melghirimyces thermohalophilus TaxID=1236220 RepID=A0A1G6QYB2_9BACL|nr:hypothetical protein [Melghirimyces thermohalophilus]SDC97429.1 hypothetical protein SAMN04488112_1252 [Melghirimyces thermohalophilus]